MEELQKRVSKLEPLEKAIKKLEDENAILLQSSANSESSGKEIIEALKKNNSDLESEKSSSQKQVSKLEKGEIFHLESHHM